MLEIFNTPDPFSYAQEHFPEFDYIKRIYLRELANVENYYHNRVYSVKSNHFLSNILYHMDVPMSYSAEQYANVATTRAPYVANALKITSEINYGRYVQGVFYGRGCTEILIHDTEYFSPSQVEKDWKSVCAVNVLLHPKSDLKLLLPNGRDTSDETGLVVVSINVALLAFQYRCFCQDQALKPTAGQSQLGIPQFIHMFVLPNMLYSHLDMVIINRMMNLFYKVPMGKPYLKHPFPVADLSKRLDHFLLNTMQHLQNQEMSYEQMLKNIPAFDFPSMDEALAIPDLAPTRQVKWALLLSRLSIMDFMMDLGGVKNQRFNQYHLNRLNRYLIRFDMDNSLISLLPSDVYFNTRSLIDSLIERTS